MHIESLEQQMRLVTHALSQTFELRAIEIVLQDRLIIWMRTFVDDDARSLARGEAADVGKALGVLSAKKLEGIPS